MHHAGCRRHIVVSEARLRIRVAAYFFFENRVSQPKFDFENLPSCHDFRHRHGADKLIVLIQPRGIFGERYSRDAPPPVPCLYC